MPMKLPRTPESTPKCLIQNRPNFAIFIQTIFANLYPKFGPCLRQTQFLSKFQIRPSKTAFFDFIHVSRTAGLLYVY